MSYDHCRACFTLAAPQRLLAIIPALGLLILPLSLAAHEPGRGLTAQFEINFLKRTIDHHFGALRLTELAAGTDTKRNAEVSPEEGTSPSPEFPSTPAKALLDEVKSLARRNNRMRPRPSEGRFFGQVRLLYGAKRQGSGGRARQKCASQALRGREGHSDRVLQRTPCIGRCHTGSAHG